MPQRKIHRLPIVLLLALTTIGCEPHDNQRLVELAEKQMDRQTEQSRQVSELQREVAEGSRRPVEADAQARTEMVALQREVQAERTELGRQRDSLEQERRELATERRTAPVIAAAITHIGLLLICTLPLILAWYLLQRPQQPADDQAVAEILLDDLATDRPLFQPSSENPHRIGLLEPGDHKRLPHDRDSSSETT